MDLVAHGPLFLEALTEEAHYKRRDVVAALEKKLADTLECSGYKLLNKVYSGKEFDPALWEEVRQAFAAHFPDLGTDL